MCVCGCVGVCQVKRRVCVCVCVRGWGGGEHLSAVLAGSHRVAGIAEHRPSKAQQQGGVRPGARRLEWRVVRMATATRAERGKSSPRGAPMQHLAPRFQSDRMAI